MFTAAVAPRASPACAVPSNSRKRNWFNSAFPEQANALSVELLNVEARDPDKRHKRRLRQASPAKSIQEPVTTPHDKCEMKQPDCAPMAELPAISVGLPIDMVQNIQRECQRLQDREEAQISRLVGIVFRRKVFIRAHDPVLVRRVVEAVADGTGIWMKLNREIKVEAKHPDMGLLDVTLVPWSCGEDYVCTRVGEPNPDIKIEVPPPTADELQVVLRFVFQRVHSMFAKDENSDERVRLIQSSILATAGSMTITECKNFVVRHCRTDIKTLRGICDPMLNPRERFMSYIN